MIPIPRRHPRHRSEQRYSAEAAALNRIHVTPMDKGIEEIFIGSLQPLPPRGSRTASSSAPLAFPCGWIQPGLPGDAQADRRYHSGPGKALHLFHTEHYGRLSEHWPDSAEPFVPGLLGENLSTTRWTGTVFAAETFFGSAGAGFREASPVHLAGRSTTTAGLPY